MSERVLTVEDEPEMQVILRDNLEYEGYEVVSATTGRGRPADGGRANNPTWCCST